MGIREVMQQHDRKHRAASVNWAQRPVKETTVDPSTFRNGHENRLVHPSDKGVQQEPKEQIFECERHSHQLLSIGCPDAGLSKRSKESVSFVALILSAAVTRYPSMYFGG